MKALSFDALIFDFDGVLVESEYAGNRQLAEYLTERGHEVSVEDAMANFMGLSGDAFLDAVSAWIGGPLPADFHEARSREDARVMAEGAGEVAGAVEFVRRLPSGLPRAIASSSSVAWVERHLDHLGLREHFGGMIFSGREHVERGKPAPDLYLHAAEALGVEIARTLILEDSPVGAKGALASGGQVIGLCAGRHCLPGHARTLRALGVSLIARDFDEVSRMIGLQGAEGPERR